MINITRTRDVKLVKLYSGSYFIKKVEKLIDAYFFDNNGFVDFKVKGRNQWGNAKTQLKAESYGKCAYCEADTAVVAHGDVEHFRPKDKYWWLAYCYDNFTFSCQICNQSFKSNHFPINGAMLPAPAMPVVKPALPALPALIALICPDPGVTDDMAVSALFGTEDAHFVNPYIQDPELIFAWEANEITKEVRMTHANSTPQALNAFNAAETYLGINRQELLSLRWKSYTTLEMFVKISQTVALAAPTAQMLQDQILKFASPEHSFSGMHRYFLRKWGKIP